MFGWIARWWRMDPEPRAMGQLRTIANEHNGDVTYAHLGRECLARIEWIDGARICGGEGRGATPQQAATQLLLMLRNAGLI